MHKDSIFKNVQNSPCAEKINVKNFFCSTEMFICKLLNDQPLFSQKKKTLRHIHPIPDAIFLYYTIRVLKRLCTREMVTFFSTVTPVQLTHSLFEVNITICQP